MDVTDAARLTCPVLLAACIHLLIGTQALADAKFTAIDLGTGTPNYGVDASGNGTITGTNGVTTTFNPVSSQNYLPTQWQNTSQGVPILAPAPIYDQDTHGNPNYAYTDSTLRFMNSQGLAFGINEFGVDGHLANSIGFLTQLQANGTWGPPIRLWSGAETFASQGSSEIGITGISPSGQVLGFGVPYPGASYPIPALYLYDMNTHSLTNMTSLINSMAWTNSTQLSGTQSQNWFSDNPVGQLDAQGRILAQATEGYTGPTHNLLLIPDGASVDPAPVPEPATWAVFATLFAGCMAYKRLRGRTPS